MTWTDRIPEPPPLYWRVRFDVEDGCLAICCLQSFDESGYDSSRWATSEKFETEEAAATWIGQQPFMQKLIMLYSLTLKAHFHEA